MGVEENTLFFIFSILHISAREHQIFKILVYNPHNTPLIMGGSYWMSCKKVNLFPGFICWIFWAQHFFCQKSFLVEILSGQKLFLVKKVSQQQNISVGHTVEFFFSVEHFVNNKKLSVGHSVKTNPRLIIWVGHLVNNKKIW